MKIQKHNYITLQDVSSNSTLLDYILELRKLTDELKLSDLEILDLEENTPVYFINNKLISTLNRKIDKNYNILDNKIDNNFIELNNKIDKIVIDGGGITDVQIGMITYKKDNFAFDNFHVISFLDNTSNRITLDFLNAPDLSELENTVKFNNSMLITHDNQINNIKNEIFELKSELMHRNYENNNRI
jgi:hypothetical protein